MQKTLLIEQGFQIWSVIEDDSPLRGLPCGPLLAQRSLASPPAPEVLRAVARATFSRFARVPAPGGSHPRWLQMQKTLLIEQGFQIWSVIEDSNRTSAPSHPRWLQRSAQIWSVIEDSNLRPLRPERSALPGCANHRMRAHLTAQAHARQSLSRKIRFNRRESRQTPYFMATFCASGIWHQLLFWLMPPFGDVYPRQPIIVSYSST